MHSNSIQFRFGNLTHRWTRVLAVVTLALVALLACPSSLWAAKKTEAQLIEMLKSRKDKDVRDALDRLPSWYPNSTNALPIIRGLLKDPSLRRSAARSLGNYHAELTSEEIKVICRFLRSPDPDEVMDGLKSLRGLNAPEAVPDIVVLLKEKDAHILRDACRTLAVLGNKDTIPAIEPLLKNAKSDVRKDARDAIAKLQVKP